MANDSMAFMERLKQQGGGDFLRSLVESVLADLMECEVTNQIGADLHERNGIAKPTATVTVPCCRDPEPAEHNQTEWN